MTLALRKKWKQGDMVHVIVIKDTVGGSISHVEQGGEYAGMAVIHNARAGYVSVSWMTLCNREWGTEFDLIGNAEPEEPVNCIVCMELQR